MLDIRAFYDWVVLSWVYNPSRLFHSFQKSQSSRRHNLRESRPPESRTRLSLGNCRGDSNEYPRFMENFRKLSLNYHQNIPTILVLLSQTELLTKPLWRKHQMVYNMQTIVEQQWEQQTLYLLDIAFCLCCFKFANHFTENFKKWLNHTALFTCIYTFTMETQHKQFNITGLKRWKIIQWNHQCATKNTF